MTITTEQAQHASNETFDVVGVQLQFLIQPAQTSDETSLYRGTLPSGVVVPLHSHPEAELFYLVEGSMDVYKDSGEQQGWSTLTAGGTLAVERGVKHALRNTSSLPATIILVTGKLLYGFFREIAKPMAASPAPPTPDDLQHLFSVAARYSFWMGSPEENAGIGISLG